MASRFEGVRLICLNAGDFRKGAAVALPGIGIITGKSNLQNENLLRHEFGHFLQYRNIGFLFYWGRIAPVSLRSALKARKKRDYNHMSCWTEWSANLLSYNYFNKPADWDADRYPLKPPLAEGSDLPENLRGKFKL